MRRADAIQEIRSTPRLCRGPQGATVTDRDVYRMSPALKLALGITAETPLEVRDTKTLISALLLESKREEAGQLDELMRAGCGYDFNNVIANNPFDGIVHPYTCPQCGVQGIYQAPLYDLED